MNRSELLDALMHNMLSITFIRRTDPRGEVRRMLCTKSNFILTSFQGRTNLNFRNPKHGGPNFDEVRTNVIVVWDILCQDYRLIPCESVNVILSVPESEFWEYYNNAIYPMTTQQKVKFMNG